MKICLICVEIFAWGKYGGFGRSTRMIGRELVNRGHRVTAVVPRRSVQKPEEELDGMRVLGFERRNPFSAIELYRQADADIYHSQEPSFGTFLAQIAMPGRKHVITFRDTRTTMDWWIEFLYPSKNRLQVISNILYEDNFLVSQAVRSADRLFSTARMLIPKARKKYRVSKDITFLPSPVPFVETVEKSEMPLACFIGRLDQRKRPQIFFELAAQFPEVQFLVVGKGQNSRWERNLLSAYKNLPNLEFLGFIDQFNSSGGLSEILSKSWILVNTSAREGLPTTFVEAASHRCAILSAINPDDFSKEFGYYVQDGDFSQGLRYLLESDRWKQKGQLGYECISKLYSVDASIRKHIEIYKNLLRQ